MPVAVAPPVVGPAPKRVVSEHQQKILRPHLSRCRSTTAKMLFASENGVVVALNRDADLSLEASHQTRCQKLPSRVTAGDESSTLRTFVSLGTSVGSDTLLLLSELCVDEHEHSTQPSARASKTPSNSCDRETKKRIHYKEQLRALSERLTTSSAVDQSRQVLTNMMGREKDEDQEAASAATQDDIETKFGRLCGSLRKKLLACTMNDLCVHDAIVDPEGLIVSVTHKNLNCLGDGTSDRIVENDGFISEVSSLTDDTYHRYQARYRVY